MFAATQYSEAMSDAQRKRAREEEEDLANANANGALSFGEHRNKRVQCLPLRTSPKASQQWLPSSSMAPQNSESDDQAPEGHLWPWPTASMEMQSQAQSQPQNDAEMDMMDDTPQHHHVQENAADLHPDNANGRMPTPIQPSFAAQVRGQQCEWAGPGPAVKTLNGVVNLGHQQTGFSDDQCVPRTMASSNAWQAVQNNRRLPSPISEGDDCMGSPTTIVSPVMAVDGGIPAHQTANLEYIAPQPSPPHAMEHPMMDVESHASPPPTEGDEDPTTPSPGRQGHARNRHTINNWTWQPGMKKSFSIGYRSDCEKCRLKVPGHFNHIIIT